MMPYSACEGCRAGYCCVSVNRPRVYVSDLVAGTCRVFPERALAVGDRVQWGAWVGELKGISGEFAWVLHDAGWGTVRLKDLVRVMTVFSLDGKSHAVYPDDVLLLEGPGQWTGRDGGVIYLNTEETITMLVGRMMPGEAITITCNKFPTTTFFKPFDIQHPMELELAV